MINGCWLEIDTPLARRIDSSLFIFFAAVRTPQNLFALARQGQSYHNYSLKNTNYSSMPTAGIISAMTSEISVAAMPVLFQPSFGCQLAGLPLPTIQ